MERAGDREPSRGFWFIQAVFPCVVPKISFRDPRMRSCLCVLPPEAVRVVPQHQTTTKEAIYAYSEKCSPIFLVRHIAVNDMRRLRSAQCTVHPRKSGPSAPAPAKRGLSWGPLCSFARCSSLNRLRLSGVPFVQKDINQMPPSALSLFVRDGRPTTPTSAGSRQDTRL